MAKGVVRTDVETTLLVLIMAASLLSVCGKSAKVAQSNVKANCYSDPPIALHFHEAMLDCSQSGGVMAFIDATSTSSSDPIKDLFTRWYSANTTETPVQRVWLAVGGTVGDPKPSWEYVYLNLQMTYEKDRAYAMSQAASRFSTSSGTRSSYVSSSINSTTVATYSCISKQCLKSKTQCPSSFIQHADNCYYIADATTSSEVTPAAQCQSAGGLLVPTKSTNEQAFLATLMNSMGVGSAYVGAEKDFGSTAWVYITSDDLSPSIAKKLNVDKTTGLRCAALELRSEEFAWSNVDCVSPLNALCIVQDPPCYLPASTNVAEKCASNPMRGARCQPSKSSKDSICQPYTTSYFFSPTSKALLAPFFKSLSCHADPCDIKTYSKAVDVCVCRKCACCGLS